MTVITLIGLGLGPSAVGLITERVFGDDAAVRYSLAIITVVGLAASAALLASSLGPYRRSVAYREAWMNAVSANGRR